jgi:hypothetical protein
MFKGSMPAAFKVKDSIACGVQGLKVQCLRRSRVQCLRRSRVPASFLAVTVQLPGAFNVQFSCGVQGFNAFGFQCSMGQSVGALNVQGFWPMDYLRNESIPLGNNRKPN